MGALEDAQRERRLRQQDRELEAMRKRGEDPGLIRKAIPKAKGAASKALSAGKKAYATGKTVYKKTEPERKAVGSFISTVYHAAEKATRPPARRRRAPARRAAPRRAAPRRAPRRAAPKRRKPKRDPWDLGIRI